MTQFEIECKWFGYLDIVIEFIELGIYRIYEVYMFKVAILTLSDKGSKGEREDSSGPLIQEMIKDLPAEIIHYEIIADEREEIAEALKKCADRLKADLILTTGGTGLSPRDVTPDATLEVIEKEAPGFAEAMRAESLKKTPMP